jgi:hypothetical protein
MVYTKDTAFDAMGFALISSTLIYRDRGHKHILQNEYFLPLGFLYAKVRVIPSIVFWG